MKVVKFNKLILGTLIAFLLPMLFSYQTNAQPAVKGTNVTEVTVTQDNATVEAILVQVGPKEWTHYYPDRQRIFTNYTETGRDEWSVYLTGPKFESVIINLFKKTVTYRYKTGGPVSYSAKILNSSDAAITDAETTATTETRSAPAETSRPSPLTINEMEHVMQWISIKTSAARLPFCWRQSVGRTAGKPMICQPGYNEETAGLCYKPCGTGEKGIATFCYKSCPSGFRDDGLYCGKPESYGRGAGYPWQIGDKPFDLDAARARCSKDNPQGCEQNGAIIYPKCKPNFHAAGSNICSPDCPQGWEDIGVSCKKPNYARDVKPLTDCPAGLEKDGALCYPKCQNDYTGVGPVCWQNCPSQQNVDCGAGCATTKGQCAKAVFTMTSAPIIAAVKIAALIVTFGGSSAATGGAASAQAGGKLALESPKLVKLAKLAADLQKIYNANEKAIKTASVTKTVLGSIKSQTDLFATEFANNFGAMTSPEIEKEIDRRFSKDAAFEIKRQWGMRHLGLMLEANGIATAKNVLDIAGTADPTGVVGVVSAFTNPLCKDDTPFPTVNPKY